MRILHIAHFDRFPHEARTFFNSNGNGIEKWLQDIISQSDDEHYVLFFNHYENTIFIEKILKTGVASVYTFYNDTTYQYGELEEIFKDIVSWLKMDLVHIHYLQDYTKDLPYILYQLDVKNIIVTMHDESFLGADYGINASNEYDERVQRFFEYSKEVVFLNQITANKFLDLYRQILGEKYSVIPNGIDLQKDYIPKNNAPEFKVLFLGTMHEVKGGKIVYELASEKISDVEYYLLGSIEKKPSFLNDCGRYDATNIKEKISAITPDLIVIPSIAEETFSYTAAEATALGYPVVVFSVGVLKDIETQQRGFVVTDKSANGLKKEILKLKNIKENDENYWNLIVENVQKYENFSTIEMYHEYMTAYRKIVKEERNDIIDWEYVFIRNNAYAKHKELQLLYKVNEIHENTLWKNEMPAILRKTYSLYRRIVTKKGTK